MQITNKSSGLFLACLALAPLALAQGGGGSPTQTAPIPVPIGSTSFSYVTYDYDPTFLDPDEVLEKEDNLPLPPVEPGGTVTIDFKDLYCEDGVVKGPGGSSGEAEAEVYVVITFHQPNGSVTVTTKTQTVRCSDLGPKPK